MIKNIIKYLYYTNKYYIIIISIILLFLSETLFREVTYLFRKQYSKNNDDEVSQKIIKPNKCQFV